VGPRAGLGGRKISSPPRFDPGPSGPMISCSLIKSYLFCFVFFSATHIDFGIRCYFGNMDGIDWPGLFERKGKYIWVPVLEPKDTKF